MIDERDLNTSNLLIIFLFFYLSLCLVRFVYYCCIVLFFFLSRLHNQICTHACAYWMITMMMNDLCFFIITIVTLIVVCKGFSFSSETYFILSHSFCYMLNICVYNEIIRYITLLALISVGTDERFFFFYYFFLSLWILLLVLLIMPIGIWIRFYMRQNSDWWREKKRGKKTYIYIFKMENSCLQFLLFQGRGFYSNEINPYIRI